MNILYYITGHGYGHAVRAIEIIKSLLNYSDIHHIYVRSTAPRWLFEPDMQNRIFYVERELDFGCIQSNSFYIDKQQTLEQYSRLLEIKRSLIDQETDFIHSHKIGLILSDITPFAFDAAHQAGAKAIAIGNFAWDWIYAQWLDEFPKYDYVVDDIRRSYSKAKQLFRLPFYGDMCAFPSIADTPLVGRKSNHPPESVRNQINKETGRDVNLVFLGLRASDLKEINWNSIQCLQQYAFVSQNRDIKGSGIINLSQSYEFYDLLSACDAVITKPGYSMVSEVIINKVPTLYVPRYDNIEDQPLIKGLKDYSVCKELPYSEFIRGNWRPFLDTLLSKPQNWPPIPCNGASFIAESIMEGV